MNGLWITDLDEIAAIDAGDVHGNSEEGAPCCSAVLGNACDGMEPLGGELASISSTGEVQTGLLEANSNAYCRTSIGLVFSIIHKFMDLSGGRKFTCMEQLLYGRYRAGVLLPTVIGHQDVSKALI